MGFRERSGVTRRQLVAGAGVGAAGVAVAAGAGFAGGEETAPDDRIAFHGAHQAGIATPPQRHLLFAAFDLSADRAGDLQELLRGWSAAAERLTAGQPIAGRATRDAPPPDPGEAAGLAPARLTLTLGLGPGLFERDGEDRLGLAPARPAALRPLPPLPGEDLDVERSGGDLCVQACADDPQIAFHAIHALTRAAAGLAIPRWSQAGFRGGGGSRPGGTRNLFGFRDGSNNIAPDDGAALRDHVWVGDDGWMRGGAYLVARRVRMLFDVWDATSLDGQERAIGRAKDSGAPLRPKPHDAHVTLASAEANGGHRLLRRSYSFSDGVEAGSGHADAGLLFLAFQRDPHEQFVPLQRRLATEDALSKHLLHTAGALFACPPGARRGGYVGERLFAA